VLLSVLLAACNDYELKPDVEDPTLGEPCPRAVLPAGETTVDRDCAFEVPPGSFTPVVEWQWSTNVGAPGYDDVMMTPVVGDLDADGVAEIVFTAYAANAYGSAGALVVLAGDGSGEKGAWTSLGGYLPLGSAGVALGDVDADGTPEIVTLSTDLRVLAVRPDGSLKWATEPTSGLFSPYGYPALADLDADGSAEVVVGRGIWNADGSFRASGAYGQGGPYSISAVADLDVDGVQEVVVGNAAYGPDGAARWYNASVPDGWTAVGDFDGDSLGEVAVVGSGGVWLLDTDGALRWGPVAVPGGGGGPPTVADFDGDGLPEIGVAGLSGYMVVDTDGAVLWTQPTTDASSAQTGSSVFDFEGDGSSEAVYADELVLWGYDGATGAPVLRDEGHSSWTLFEYPVVADVDADGEAELLVASNDSINPGWQGITVIGDASRSWAPAAPVWNQHAWHISNAEDDLSIPPAPTMNWLTGHNSYRAGGVRAGPGNPAPNLWGEVVEVCWRCETEAAVQVRIANAGTADVEDDVVVELYAVAGDGSVSELARGTVTGGVAAGRTSEGLWLEVEVRALGRAEGLEVYVDAEGVVEECDEDDNTRTSQPGACAE